MSGNLKTVEIKAFVPAKDFALSQRFCRDLGFTMASEGGIAYFHHGGASFLLSDFYLPAMIDFTVTDPSGVCWRIAQNIPRKA